MEDAYLPDRVYGRVNNSEYYQRLTERKHVERPACYGRRFDCLECLLCQRDIWIVVWGDVDTVCDAHYYLP